MDSRVVFLALSFLALVTAESRAQDLERDRFAGKYTVSGSTTDGRTYRGEVTITRRGELYVMRWVLESGETYDGVGIAEGAPRGVGSRSMYERADELQGTIDIRTTDQGTTIHAELPLTVSGP